MTSKHTQGPWSFDPKDSSIVGKDEGLSIATIDNIDVGGEKGFHFGEESKANARLIATAPEMLEALQELSRYAPGEYFNDPRSDYEIDAGHEAAHETARAIIAKATGKSA